jgi:hypothetical protein
MWSGGSDHDDTIGCRRAGARLVASEADVGDWGPWPNSKDSPFVAAGFKHDDDGALIIMCDTNAKLMSLGIEEPRASWKAGTPMEVTTKADTGTNGPSHGVAIAPTRLIVKDDSTGDLHTMGKVQGFFAIGVGGYARIYPTANFRKAVDPVLAACGDHF